VPILDHAVGAASSIRVAKATLIMFWLRGNTLIFNELRTLASWGLRTPHYNTMWQD
jgi:hypothetical protein